LAISKWFGSHINLQFVLGDVSSHESKPSSASSWWYFSSKLGNIYGMKPFKHPFEKNSEVEAHMVMSHFEFCCDIR